MVKRLGTEKHPIVLRVRSMDRAAEVLGICESRNVKAIVGIEEDKEEDLSDLYRVPIRAGLDLPDNPIPATPTRNAPCYCGSGRKFKKCCGR